MMDAQLRANNTTYLCRHFELRSQLTHLGSRANIPARSFHARCDTLFPQHLQTDKHEERQPAASPEDPNEERPTGSGEHGS
jgi:hypothetical protein